MDGKAAKAIIPNINKTTNGQDALKTSAICTLSAAPWNAKITYPNGGEIPPTVTFRSIISQNQMGSKPSVVRSGWYIGMTTNIKAI